MQNQITAYIGLGSNLGDRENYIHTAAKTLAETRDIEVSAISDIIETSPLGGADQPKYLNAVAEIKTNLTPQDLLKKMLDIESSLDREKHQKWFPRTIDLDLLLFGDTIINTPDLIVPHLQMHLRCFVLGPLTQLNPDLLHPVIKEPISELAARLNGADFTLNQNLPQLVSIAGIIGVGKTTLTKKLSNLLKCKPIFEAYDKNPYMPDVYAGKKNMALDSQIYFLTSRLEQLSRDTLEHGQFVISDYVFDKEQIYAKRLLDSGQLTSYQKVYQPLSAKIASPVLVIYLTDSVQNCLQRIHKRNRPYEQKIQMQFLNDLSTDYDQLFADWKTSPVIRISLSKFDCNCDADINHLANQIRNYTMTADI